MLLEALASPSPRQVMHSLEILERNCRGHLVPPLLLYHDDPAVRCRTLEILARVGREDTAHLVERHLGDADPRVRAEAIRTLATLRGEGARELMLPRLHEPDAAVRAAAVAFLLEHGAGAEVTRALRVLADLLADGEPATRIEGAKALGGVGGSIGIDELLRLARDPDVSVVRAAIDSVRRRVERNGFDPLYVPTLVACLGDRRIRHDAQAALLAFGRVAVPSLAHFLRDPDESDGVREALPGVLARIASPESAEELLRVLETDTLEVAAPGRRRRRLIEAMLLVARRSEEFRYATDRILAEAERETRAFAHDLVYLHALGGTTAPDFSGPLPRWTRGHDGADLLHRLLVERLDTRLWCLCSLLSLTSETEDFRIAYHGLKLPEGRGRARALELLSHVLSSRVRAEVLAVLDDAPIDQRIEGIGRRFNIERPSRRDALLAFLRPGASGERRPALTAAALYLIHTTRERGFEKEVDQLARVAGDELVRETAAWVEDHRP